MRAVLPLLAVCAVVAGCGSDGTSPADESLSGKPAAIRVTSTDFIHNGKLPADRIPLPVQDALKELGVAEVATNDVVVTERRKIKIDA